MFWLIRHRGYKRSITGLYRVLKRLSLTAVKPKKSKYIPKPYEKMDCPGQRIQIDVKFIPSASIVGEAKAQGCKFYEYTAIDEYSHWRYTEAFEEHGSYLSMQLSA